jgi:iron complex transport system permease protein
MAFYTTHKTPLLYSLLPLLLLIHAAVVGGADSDGFFAQTSRYIYLYLALPELLTAAIVGAAIASASATLQILLRNPLADPSIVGISVGASLSAALVLTTPLGLWLAPAIALPVLCFIGAGLSTWLLAVVAKRIRHAQGSVILAGIALTTLGSALLSWLYVFATPQQAKSLTFWLLGSASQTTWFLLLPGIVLIALGLWGIWRKIPILNQLLVGEQIAAEHGVDVPNETRYLLACSALAVGASVALAGSVAFVGLLVPHLIRQLVGSDNRLVLPLSAVTGAGLLMSIVIINQLLGGIALPLSLITASIGAPFFIYVLLHRAQGLAHG